MSDAPSGGHKSGSTGEPSDTHESQAGSAADAGAREEPSPDVAPVEVAHSGTEQTFCSECAEMVAFDARVCRFCGATRLRDVHIKRALAGRDAYLMARDVAQLRPELSHGQVHRSLLDPERPLARKLEPREQASIQDLAQRHGAEVELRLPRRFPDLPWLRIGAAAGGVILLATTIIVLVRLSATPEVQALDGAAITAKVMPSVVVIRSRCGLGSGFFITERRLVTNHHVVCDVDATVQVETSKGEELEGTVVDSDAVLDIAIIETSSPGPGVAELGDAAQLQQGGTVYALGNPKGQEFTITRGVVSHRSRFSEGYAMIQTDASVNPGNSGGPLTNDTGRVVGVVSQKAQAEGIAFALPVNYLYSGASRSRHRFDPSEAEPPALVVAPEGYSEVGWLDLSAEVGVERDKQLQEMKELLGEPLPAFARLRGNTLFYGVIVMGRRPEPTSIEFEILTEKKASCFLSRRLHQWEEVDSLMGEKMSPRARRWFERSVSGAFYLSVVEVRLDRKCSVARDDVASSVHLMGAPEEHSAVDVISERK